MRIWWHVMHYDHKHVLVYSLDTDVYNIGLSLIQATDKECFVQVNMPHNADTKYIHLNKLINALSLDPDLACIPCNKLTRILQMLYICSGCDYISYFYGYGKSAFFNTFHQHASFITMEGLLCDYEFQNREWVLILCVTDRHSVLQKVSLNICVTQRLLYTTIAVQFSQQY